MSDSEDNAVMNFRHHAARLLREHFPEAADLLMAMPVSMHYVPIKAIPLTEEEQRHVEEFLKTYGDKP